MLFCTWYCSRKRRRNEKRVNLSRSLLRSHPHPQWYHRYWQHKLSKLNKLYDPWSAFNWCVPPGHQLTQQGVTCFCHQHVAHWVPILSARTHTHTPVPCLVMNFNIHPSLIATWPRRAHGALFAQLIDWKRVPTINLTPDSSSSLPWWWQQGLGSHNQSFEVTYAQLQPIYVVEKFQHVRGDPGPV